MSFEAICVSHELKRFVLIVFFLVIGFPVLAQVTGDYRSKATGNWNSSSAWEIYNGSSWVNAISYPGQNSNVATVTIGSGNTVTLNVDITSMLLSKF